MRDVATILRGALVGGLATLPMTATMAAVRGLLPGAAREPLTPYLVMQRIGTRLGLWQRAAQEDQLALTGAAHIGYGAAAGAFYAPIARRLQLPPVAGGIAYGLFVWIVSYQGWLPAVKILRPASQGPKPRQLQLISAHIVWGAGVGWMLKHLSRQASRS